MSNPAGPKKIDALYAWICKEPDGGEGLCGALLPGLEGAEGPVWTALVGADMDRVKSLRPYAEMTRTATGYPVTLIRLTRREDLEELP